MADSLLPLVRQHRLLVIYRGQTPQQCLAMTELLYHEGVRLFEVTLNSEQPYAAIAALHEKYGHEVPIGAGTVMSAEDVSRAADAGASFVVSPNVDEAVQERAKVLGLGTVPGAFTPTEVVRAVQLGADVVKVFPIAPVGAGYIRQLRGPLPDVPMLATGGVDDAQFARECLQNGSVGVGVGAHLLGDLQDPEALTRNARAFVEATR